MPRTTTLECSGCPPIRALTFDVLGLIKVIEARTKEGGVAKVVEKWGEPDPAKCLLAASIDDRKSDPLLAVARRNGAIEILNPLNGDVRVMISSACDGGSQPDDDAIAGLHLLKTKGLELSSRSCTLLSCTRKGNAIMRSVEVTNSREDSAQADSSNTWNICASGTIECSKVDGNENYALFGGKGVEVNVWDLDTCSKIWMAKSPPKNSLGIFTPTWFTSAAFLSKDDHRKFVAGTNSHQVRLYDISAQRRPVLSFDFRETAIKSVTEDLDGHKVYVGNGSGDLASFDMRTGKLLGCFLGKCSGSIRSIARHPELPVIASCGLDSYLRLWDVNTRQLVSAVFLKQHLTNVVFDSNFSDEEPANPAADALPNEALNQEMEEETLPVKRKKNKPSNKTEGSKKRAFNNEEIENADEEETLPVKRKKKKASNNQEIENVDEEDASVVKRKKKKASNTSEGSKKSTSKEQEEGKRLKSKKRSKKKVKGDDGSDDDASDS